MYTLGVNPTDVFTPSLMEQAAVLLAPGTRAVNQNGNEYILLVSGAAIATVGNLGFWDENFIFTLVSSANDVGGTPLAINRGTPTVAAQRFWAQTYGQGTVLAAAAATADTTLYTTATPGAVDDVSATFFAVLGLQLMVAAGGAAATAARISYPTLAHVVS
jgi:hypothetical protein